MEQSIKAQDTKINTLDHKNQDLVNKTKHLELRVAVLEQGARQVEQNALSASLEIAGLPDFSPVELNNVITAVASKLDVDEGEIQSTQRLSSGMDKPCTILLELKSKNARNKWITASKEKSISVAQILPNVVKEKADNRVFIREALTKHVKTLLYNAKLKLCNSFQFVWCKDGKVCARKTNNSKIFYIRCLQDIDLALKETAISS
ncbi:jg1043 [Pararge aegeria aegeria]|uniref:Jg1043 protein n=1 Tax=Pararge aegeria aegeria TaxID=348720 RepID=A0A8S4QI17_9NEOP|nr:jg1043 [Pararge aegeria aegeria]